MVRDGFRNHPLHATNSEHSLGVLLGRSLDSEETRGELPGFWTNCSLAIVGRGDVLRPHPSSPSCSRGEQLSVQRGLTGAHITFELTTRVFPSKSAE